MTAHIVTFGGGGFSMSTTVTPTSLDRYLLELSGVRSPRVCFAPTASADDPQYINKFLVAYGALGVRPMILTLWEDAKHSVSRLEEADVIVVGGGSTVNLLALWDAHGVSDVMRRLAAEKDNVVFGGVSAGANCWFEAFSTDSFGGFDPYVGGLGMIPGSFCPHFDGEAERAPRFTNWISDGTLPGGWACDDGAAIHFVDGQPTDFVAERPGPKAYRIEPSDNPSSSGVLVEAQQMDLL